MGAKKPPTSSSTKPAKTLGKTNNKNRLVDASNTAKSVPLKSAATKVRSNTPITNIEKTTPVSTVTTASQNSRKEKDEFKILTLQKTTPVSAMVNTTKTSQLKKAATPLPSRSVSPRKSPFRQKLVNEEKSKAMNKVMKSLDIKITGFKNTVSDEQKVECKASISEIVKTKSRATSAKISPGPMGKTVRLEEEEVPAMKKSFSDVQEIRSSSAPQKCEEMLNNELMDNTSSNENSVELKRSEVDKTPKTVVEVKPPKKSKTVKKSNEGEKVKKSTKKNIKSIVSSIAESTDAPEGQEILQTSIQGEGAKLEAKKPKKVAKSTHAKLANKKQCVSKKDNVSANEKADSNLKLKSSKSSVVKPQDETSIEVKGEVAAKLNEKNNLSSAKSKQNKQNKQTKKVEEGENVLDKRKCEKDIEKSVEGKAVKKPKQATKSKKATSAAIKIDVKNKESTVTSEESRSNVDQSKDIEQVQDFAISDSKVGSKLELEVKAQPSLNKQTAKLNCQIKDPKISCIKETKNTEKLPATQNKISSPSKKVISVRERLQKKYVGNKTTTFMAYKAKKQTVASKKPAANLSPRRDQTKSPCKKSAFSPSGGVKKGDDIYDFKTESESDDNIKMNLIIETSMLSKLSKLAKANATKKQEDEEKSKETNEIQNKTITQEDIQKDSVIEEKQKAEVKSVAKAKEKSKMKGEKEYSDEDDRPLQQTKKLLDDANKLKTDNDKVKEKASLTKLKEEVKSEPKKPAKNVKASKPKPVKKAPIAKRKGRVESTNSDDSDNDDSYDTTSSSSSSSESCRSFGPKRHRMASLNALAKVQCLYENESRTAHELGLSKSSQAPKIRIIASGTSSDEEENAAKKLKKEGAKEEILKEEKEEESAPEEENKRELRNAPGMRGMGKHWEFNDASSFESGHESDVTFRRGDDKSKPKKRKIVKSKPVAKTKDKVDTGKAKKTAAPIKTPKKKVRPQSSKEVSESSDEDDSDKNQQKKRKRENTPDIKVNITSKRMASLNASAIVAATYEVERHLDRNLDSDCSSFESLLEEVKSEATKKIKEQPVKSDSVEDTSKDNSRPTSTSVVIVQDTDVTITGVYVNSTNGAAQESYCKMQYRVQSSVTEERVVRPSSIDPPKSYTPLSALSSMRPPGADAGQVVVSPEDLSPVLTQQTFQPTIVNRGEHPPSSFPGQQQQQHQINAHYPQHHHHHPQPPLQPTSQEQMHHMHHQQSPPKYHHMHHHHHQQPPLAQPRCESPLRYAPGAYQNVQPPMPPPPNTISISGGGSSAFCAPSMQQQSHHDISGYYQPAGPLISQHGLPPGSANNSSLVVSTKQISSPLDPERDHQISQIPHQPGSSTDSPDNDILITGGDLSTFRYPSQQSQQGQQQSQALSTLASSQPPPQQQGSPYSRQIHPMHYPPYPPSYYSPYPGDAMCYPPPYQHYFPAKVYQTAPTYRRYSSYYQPGPPPPSDLYDPPPPPSNAGQVPPPPSGSQLVPTGPGGPQHIEHYTGPPGYYTSFNPGGGECYPPRGMQPPYMEYPAPCPCPMQSCPKNVHTGPLIGSNSSNSASNNLNSNNLNSNPAINSNNTCNITSNSTSNSSINSSNSIAGTNSNNFSNLSQQLNTSKGPVRMHNNHMIGKQHEQTVQPPNSNLPNGQNNLGKPIHHHHHQCKREIIETLKSEIKSDAISESISSTETRKTGQYEETVVPPTPPTLYTVNDKLVEPESTLSPARASTGPQTVPEKCEEAAAQPKRMDSCGQTVISPPINEFDGSNTHIPPIIGRKARIGKSMAREMMYGAHVLNTSHQHPHVLGEQTHLHKNQHQHIPSHNSAEANKVPVSISLDVPITPDVNRIKKEEIKIEDEDDVVILEDLKEIKSEPEIVEVSDKLSDVEEGRDYNKPESENTSSPRISAKRVNILDTMSLCKKSSFNGYKSLIKQTEPKSYLCLSAKKREKRSLFRKYSKLLPRHGIRKRKLVLTEQQRERLSLRKRNLIMMERERQRKRQEMISNKAKSANSFREESRTGQDNNSNKLDFQTQDSPRDYTNDSRGYFSEPDIRTSGSRKTKKTRSNEARSKSETKKSKTHKKGVTTNENSTSNKMMPKLPGNNSMNSQRGKTENCSRNCKKSSKSKKKSKSQNSADEHQIEDNSQPIINLTNTQSIPESIERMDIDERVTIDNSLIEQNNNNNNSDDINYTLTIPTTVSHTLTIATTTMHCKTSTCGKRSRTRGHRFSKKRPKYRRYQTEVDDSIIPRKTNAVPKWNNGWSWLGEPFQAKVFLNSDDPLVIRTCYPAMRHIEGDIIQPRDCVLLKAGNKKNELPYVAKVAHLWENPEDGEMMMSLLWYYRPEHTEQGRQPIDCTDEVFASRHRDHNSVACIEDKCYVLTFSEYCRYRKRVRAAEEGIEMENRIVPILKTTVTNLPRVPVTTNPEQVMFCQRVYEFRLKRLLKTPTN